MMKNVAPELAKAFRQLNYPEINYGPDFIEGSTGTGFRFEIKIKCWKT